MAEAPPPTRLLAKTLRKTHPDGTVGLDLDLLELQAGQVALLLGDNGAGKTTLLRIAAGLLAPDPGFEFRLDNAAVDRIQPGQDAVYMHQRPYLLNRTVRANCEYVLRLQGRDPAEAAGLLAWAGLAGMEERHAHQLSEGEQRRLALARVYATQTPLVLLDEPMANIDDYGRAAVVAMMQDMAAAGRAVMASFQLKDVPESLPGGERLVLAKGRRVAQQQG